MDLAPLDLDDDDLLAQAYAVECAATRATRVGWVPMAAGARIHGWRGGAGWDNRLVGAFDGRRLVGVASSMTHRNESATTWIDVAVAPAHQRRGHGARLVQEAERLSPGGAGHRFVGSAYRPTAEEAHRLVEGFAQPLGYAFATTETVVVLGPHRGRRLGAAVKAASLRAAHGHGATRVRTSSDDQNRWMRAINEELGFLPVEAEVVVSRSGTAAPGLPPRD